MHNDLLALAKRLARLEPRRPKQASLRRSISTAYYALFHYLIDQSCRTTMGAQHAQAPYRHVVGRSFMHADMKSACKSFASGGALKRGAAKGLPATFRIAPEIRKVAEVFVSLQQMRQVADYDLTARFSRFDALSAVRDVDVVIKRFSGLALSDEKKFFLACLWAWKNLANR